MLSQGAGIYNYRMANLAVDNGMAWIEAKDDDGLGEWFLYEFDQEKTVNAIIFRNGYTRTDNSFAKNNRVAGIEIELSNGSNHYVNMSDGSELQRYTLPEPEQAKWVKITIVRVFKGNTYADTALSYVEFR